MKFSEKFKKNKGEAAVPETAQDSGKKKHKPDLHSQQVLL